MKNHSLAVTAVGMAHGHQDAGPHQAAAPEVRFMMTANQKPSTVSKATVTTVKKNVIADGGQNCAPRVPGGQCTVPPPESGTAGAASACSCRSRRSPPLTKSPVAGSSAGSFWKDMIDGA